MFIEREIKGTSDSSFHASERTVYKELQSVTSSDKEQEGIAENSNFLREKKTVRGLKIGPN